MKRRTFIRALSFGLGAAYILPLRAMAAIWNKSAFDAVKSEDALQRLAVSNVTSSQEIQIIAPERAENGAIVQVEIDSRITNTQDIYILVDKNPTALIGQFILSNGVQGKLVTRIKMAETADIIVIVQAEGKFYRANKQVQVMENGCGGGGNANEKFEPSMKMRAKLVGDVAEIKAIIVHPMHTGHAKDDFGQLIAADFIQTADVYLNDQPILRMQWGTGIAKNPYLTFYLKGTKVGDKISLVWQDNHRRTASGETLVAE